MLGSGAGVAFGQQGEVTVGNSFHEVEHAWRPVLPRWPGPRRASSSMTCSSAAPRSQERTRTTGGTGGALGRGALRPRDGRGRKVLRTQSSVAVDDACVPLGARSVVTSTTGGPATTAPGPTIQLSRSPSLDRRWGWPTSWTLLAGGRASGEPFCAPFLAHPDVADVRVFAAGVDADNQASQRLRWLQTGRCRTGTGRTPFVTSCAARLHQMSPRAGADRPDCRSSIGQDRLFPAATNGHKALPEPRQLPQDSGEPQRRPQVGTGRSPVRAGVDQGPVRCW